MMEGDAGEDYDHGPDRAFWERVDRARRRLLALDYDGTLAPFREQRMEARPLPGVSEALTEIIKDPDTRLAVVSGRPLTELDALLGPLAREVTAAGAHGWELRRPGHGTETAALAPELEAVLDRAHALAFSLALEVLGSEGAQRVERKAASAAAHVRGVEPGAAAPFLERLTTAWQAEVRPGLEVMAFDGGLELRATARDKGAALRDLMGQAPESDFTVYVGDDRTDEDAFRVVAHAGAGIKVGGPGEPTAAAYRLPDVAAVLDFLRQWPRRTGRKEAR